MELEKVFPFGLGKDGSVCRLYCFHHAGGSVCTFKRWLDISSLIEVVPLELPDRSRDPDTLTFKGVVRDMSDAVLQVDDGRPFFIYGHSLGSLFGFRTAWELAEKYGLKARRLFVAGRHAPPEESVSKFRYSHGIDALAEELKRSDMIDEAMLSDKTFREIFLPMIYNDYRLNEEYIYENEIIDIPITAMNGDQDPDAGTDIVDKWANVTSAGFERYSFQGGHFFPYGQDEPKVLELIKNRIMQCLGISEKHTEGV